MFGDPKFDPSKIRRLAAVTKQLQNTGAGAKNLILYDEDGRRVKTAEILGMLSQFLLMLSYLSIIDTRSTNIEAQGRSGSRKDKSRSSSRAPTALGAGDALNSARSASDSSSDSDASSDYLDDPVASPGNHGNGSPALTPSKQELFRDSPSGSKRGMRASTIVQNPALKKVYDKNPHYKLTPLVPDRGFDKGTQDLSISYLYSALTI
jgi:hypothetical protein